MRGLDDNAKRAGVTFPVRPLPTANDRPRITTVNSPLAVFGPWAEGTWLVVDIDVDCRVVAKADAPQPTEAALTNVPKLQAGVHDFTMPKGCQYVVVSTVTQPPPTHEISVWPADVGDAIGDCP